MVKKEKFEHEREINNQIKQIIQRLREEREKQGISQMDLSFKAGLSQNQVNYIETGKRTPNLNTILCICKVLQINPAVLFESNDTDRQQAREIIIRLVSKFL
ncbi:MAG: helix-turn-helix domain-containing protein [Treponema sp.]|jgi:transcriptional regulator with XRE-family HTH domain|nr:helix-turn-helix domain-containing protein [Treponema sp.]